MYLLVLVARSYPWDVPECRWKKCSPTIVLHCRLREYGITSQPAK
jgi:hypothetical protein